MAEFVVRVPLRRIRLATWLVGAFARVAGVVFHGLSYLYPAGVPRPHITVSVDFPETR